MSLALTPKIDTLRSRAQCLAAARTFFADRGVLEVDCGALVRAAPIDSNIDVMSVAVSAHETGYLHTSPEYAMKQLLSEGIGDIFFLGHVYRKGEIGRKHNPEFTMAEWYRIGLPFSGMMEETCDFIALFAGSLPRRVLSYRDAFRIYAGVDYTRDSVSQLLTAAARHSIDLPSNVSLWKRDSILHLLLTHVIEPKLGQNEMTILSDYPPYEAALACVVERNGEPVAERFEVYIDGVELANGYHELADAVELRRRFCKENEERKKEGKEPYALDEQFLSSLGTFPDCCGVSVGFDRVFMLRQKLNSLSEGISYAWSY
ncbi:MAG: EF-P lysine aminoacylase GenX [Verrucomicrobia bacterium]|nr:EF-P lysine aminoacylase GenX [Verrucomicrobiota bacterium]